MRLAITGAGMIVKDFLSMVGDLPDIQVEAIVGRKSGEANLRELQDRYGIQRVYFDLAECLQDAMIDTVYVAVPNHLHYAYAKAALLAGKHVICEKPFTLTLAELEELVQLAVTKNLVLIEAITNQYLPNFQQIKQQLPAIGPVKIVECNYSQYSSRYDAFKQGTILPAFDPALGGGALMDINSYNVHLVAGLFGQPEAIHYHANVTNEIDTSGILFLEYGNMKAVCIGAKDSAASSHITIQGEKGTIHVAGAANTLSEVTIQLTDDDEIQTYRNSHPHRMYEEFRRFAEVIQQNDRPFVEQQLAHSLLVMKIITIGLDSADIQLGEHQHRYF